MTEDSIPPGTAALVGHLSLHHIGVVVRSIEEALPTYQAALGAVPLGGRIHDPVQQVYLMFVRLPDRTLVELIEPASNQSPVARALTKGGGANHLCFEVDDLEAELARLRPCCVPIGTPRAAVAFDGRRVLFLLLGKHLVIELLERASGERPDVNGLSRLA